MGVQIVESNPAFDGPDAASPLVDRIRAQAARQPDKLVLTFLGDAGAAEVNLTYAELDARARALATRLQAEGAHGERVLIALAPSADYVISLFGCFYAGAVAVPAYPPRRRNSERLLGIVADCTARFGIVDRANREWFFEQANQHLGPSVPAMQYVSCEDLEQVDASAWRLMPRAAHAPALLQYTSGSTSAPKGVVLSEENFIANVDTLVGRIGLQPDDRVVCWLPPFHDMGLISGILSPLCHGVPTVLMSPLAFQRRPLKWLEAISHYKGTISGGPNFGYDLCARRLASSDKLAALDLSRWRVAFCGAERIRAETFEQFAQVMAPAGFQAKALTPCYGLAESTVCVSFGRGGDGWRILDLDEAELRHGRITEAAGSKPGIRLVGCSAPLDECDLRIVDPQTQELAGPHHIGEIWVRSRSVGAGYWGKGELTRQSFGAHIAQATDPAATYLRTGDLGFMHKGELFVAGRIKDLIILRGVNHFPEDIEASVNACLGDAQGGAIAAMSVDSKGEESLVVVLEIDASHQAQASAMSEAIRDAISERHEIFVEDIVWVAPGIIPRTSSGKVQRSACRAMYAADEFVRVAVADIRTSAAAPAEDMVGQVASVMASLLELPSVAPTDDFFWLGGHSLLATQLVSRLRQMYAVDVSLRNVFEGTTPQKLAAIMAGLPRIAELPPILPAAPGADKVLSYSQERMWLLNQLDPTSAAYNVGGVLVFEGPLDVKALQRAFECVVQRHEVLRATFPAADGAPTMVIADSVSLPFPQYDVSAEPDPEASAKAGAQVLLNQPFDVANDTLLRFAVWKLAPERHFLGGSMHHLVTDAWSLGLFIADLLQYYDELVAGREPVIQPTPYAYSDFARWHREQFTAERMKGELDWWVKRLEGASSLEVPTDQPRAGRHSSAGAYVPITLPLDLLDALTLVGTQHGTTLFMVLLAAYELLLARYTGSDDLVVGIPVANRNALASESLMGSMVNTLALRTRIQPQQPFLTLLKEVRENAIDAYSHQDLPYERLVALMRMDRRSGESPLINVMFDFQNAPIPGRSSGPLRVRPMHLSRGSAQFDLNLLIMDAELGRGVGMEYKTELFDESTVRRLLRHYVAILEQIVVDVSTPVAQFVLVNEAERQEQLSLAVPAQAPAAPMPSVPECIRALAQTQPQATALVDDAGSLSYAELDDRANRLAAVLAQKGAGAGQRVGVMLERSRDLVVALLATLKTGAAYVPLDPRFPAERIRYVIEDAQPCVVVTRSEWQELASALPAGSCMVLDQMQLPASGATAALAAVASQPPAQDAPAYVIYTSGSTGRPKGVAVPMSALGNFLGSMAHTPGLTAQDRVLAITTVAFDIAGLEIWLPLVKGASLRILKEEESSDPVALMQRMQEWRPTLMQATPATWKMLLAADWAGDAALRILCGGEAMPPDLAQALLPRCGALWNMYGPTETTIWSAVHRVQAGEVGPVPIGHPIDRTRLYVLDALGNLQPRGAAGELFIGGEGVALGYFNRPELSAERFVPDPFSSEPGARMYRTGDGARLRSDGRFECLARIDDQIKLRGFRIEPGEIEAVLKEDADVQDAVVVAVGTPSEDVRLVGYYVAQAQDDKPEAHEERLFALLGRRLPDYMVPSALMRLDRLPQTPNGKVDRRALPAPQFGLRVQGHVHVAPRDDIERVLAAIWQDLLQLPTVGVHDNFFRIGGYSLLAMRVLAQIRNQLGVTLPPAVLINRPTIEQLAQEVRRAHKDTVQDAQPADGQTPALRYLVPFGPLGKGPKLVCVHGAGGNVLNFSALSERLGKDQVLLGFQARGVNGQDQPFTRIEDMATAYLQELRSVQPEGPYFLSGYCGGGIVAYEMANMLRREGQEVPLLVLIDCYYPGLEIPSQSRMKRWSQGVREGGLDYLKRRSRAWLERNTQIIKAVTAIAVHRLRGETIPYELRDFWLTLAFTRSVRRYEPVRYAGELTLMRATDIDRRLASVGRDLGWAGLAQATRTYDVPGTHLTLLDQAHVDVLAATISECLDQAVAASK